MTVSNWTAADTTRAQDIWADYQRKHDLSDRAGQTVGIDPATGRLWFGHAIQEIVAQRDAQGETGPLFFERVGSRTYFR